MLCGTNGCLRVQGFTPWQVLGRSSAGAFASDRAGRILIRPETEHTSWDRWVDGSADLRASAQLAGLSAPIAPRKTQGSSIPVDATRCVCRKAATNQLPKAVRAAGLATTNRRLPNLGKASTPSARHPDANGI